MFVSLMLVRQNYLKSKNQCLDGKIVKTDLDDMFIPKAYLLHQTYKKNHSDMMQRIENEKKLVAGELVSLLRNPQTHKDGFTSCSFNKENYPILTTDHSQPWLEEVMNLFRHAGYDVTLEREAEHFSIALDWTKECSGQPHCAKDLEIPPYVKMASEKEAAVEVVEKDAL